MCAKTQLICIEFRHKKVLYIVSFQGDYNTVLLYLLRAIFFK